MRIQLTSLLLLYWTAFASGAVKSLLQPIDDCDSQASLFKEEKSYYYYYDLENTAINPNGEERFVLDIECDIRLDALGKCQYVLNIKDCHFFKEQNVPHEQTGSFSKQMAKYAVLFTMSQDNVTSVYAHENEDKAWLNIKRGIIAIFQSGHIDQLNEKSPIYRKRNSLQGICDVRYEIGLQRTVTTQKRLRNCTLVDGPFVHGGEDCRHHFNGDNDIYNVSCIEYSSHTNRFLLLYPFFRRSLRLVKTTPLVVQIDPEIYWANYRTTNIYFEHEDPPKSNPPNLKKTVMELIERLVELPHSPIQSETFWLFNDLVEILNSSVDLESLSMGFDDCWGSLKCQLSARDAEGTRLHFGHIWRDALVKCRSTACVKALVLFVTQSNASMADIFSNEIIQDIYHEWLIDGSTDLEFIYSIFDICHFKNHTLCYLALSSNIHRYWKLNSNISPIPEKLKAIVAKTIEPIKQSCENADFTTIRDLPIHCHSKKPETYENSRRIRSLKMLSNIGEFAEVVEPDLINLIFRCATKTTTDGFLSPIAVEALRRLGPTSKLYENLLNIIKNHSLQQESRVNAYLILVDKWSEKAADDIDSILKSVTIDDTIKTFIYSHIKAVLRAQDHVRIRLAEAFRKIVDNNTLDYFSYNTDEKLVSKYSENGLFFLPPSTYGKEYLYGYQGIETNLYDGTSFFPSSLMNKLKLTLDGKEYDFGEVSIYSNAFMNSITSYLQNTFEDKYDAEYLKEKFMPWLISKQKTSASKFILDNLDKNIANKLGNIIKKLSKSLKAKPLALLSSKTLGEVSQYAEYSEVLASIGRLISPSAKSTMYRENIELQKYSFTLCTSGGLPLTSFLHSDFTILYFSRSYVHKSDQNATSVEVFNIGIHSSFAIGAQFSWVVDLPGFYRKGFGDDYIASAFGGVDADVSSERSEGLINGTVQLDLQPNSKHPVVISHQIVAIEDNKRQLALANKENETECYNFVHICRTRRYEKGAGLPQFYNKWELQIPDKHPAVLLLKYISKDNETASSNHLSLSASSKIKGEGVETSRQLLYLNYLHDKPKKTERIRVGSDLLPNFKLDVTYDNLKLVENAIQYKGSSTADFGFDYHYEMLASRFADDVFTITRSPDAKNKPLKNVLGNFDVHRFVSFTPKGNFSIDYVKQQYPISSERVLTLAFKCINTDATNWLRDILQMSEVWEYSETVKLIVSHETESILDHFESGVPEYRTHTAFRFPKYKIEVDSGSSIVDEHSVLSTLNITAHSLPDKTQQFSHNLSLLETSVRDEFNVSTNKILATFSVPHIKWIFSFDHQLQGNGNRDLVLKVQRRVDLKEDDAGRQITSQRYYMYWVFNSELPLNQEITFNFAMARTNNNDGDTILTSFNYMGFPWLNTKNDSIGRIQFELRTNEPERHISYSLSSSLHDRALYGDLTADRKLYHKLVLVDKANASIFQLATNISKYFPSIDHIHFINNFTSDVYSYLNQLNILIGKGLNDVTIDYSIVAHSPEWNLLNVDLNHHMENSIETTAVRHALVDIEGKGSLAEGYDTSVTFISKADWISTMQWKLNCESIHKCVAQGTFTKPEAPTFFIVSELSPGKTELAFTICKNKICKDIVTDPDYFVLKAVFSLIDPFTIVRTVTFNHPQFHEDFEIIISNILKAIFRTTKEILHSPNHPFHKIYRHLVGISTEETITRFVMTGTAINELLLPDVVATFGPVVLQIMHGSSSDSDIIRELLPTTWGLKEINFQLQRLILILQSFRQRPGPYPGHSSVVEFQLPFALKPTTYWSPIQWRPKSFYLWNGLRDDEHVIHNVFHDERYSRVALLIGNDIVRPFEGGLIKIRDPRFPQLLALDVEEQLFIVYKQNDWLHIILSDTHLEISYTKGQLIINTLHHELPFQPASGKFSVIREGDLIILDTAYHLKITCDVSDHYCVFFTDFWKFGKLYGLLGNNTDAVFAQQSKVYARDYFSMFTLSDQTNLTATNGHGNGLKLDKKVNRRPPYEGGCGLFNYWQPQYPTFVCNDKIDPEPYFEVCVEQGRRSVTRAYLAACGALDVPVNLDYRWDYECDGDHYLDTEWREFRDQKVIDVVFVVDQSLDLKYEKSYLKGLSKLTENIKNEFSRNSYSEMKFSLIGLRGSGALAAPTLYTSKSKIWGSAEEFSSSALNNLFSIKPSNKSDSGSYDLLDAIWLTMDTIPFTSQAARIIVLVTPQDPFDHVDVEDLYYTLSNLNSHQTTLHTISNYKELPKGAYGIVGNQLLRPKSLKTPIPTPPSGLNELIPGHAARLALATKGAVWSLSHLESGHDENQKEFLSEISVAMVNRAQDFLNRYYHCTCNAPDYLRPFSTCEFV